MKLNLCKTTMGSSSLDREANLQFAKMSIEWDVVIIGGGATGLGIAVDASARGYRTLLLEQADFAKGTSSRSTKLVHGGVRYLAQGDIKLVYSALHERGIIFRNAPHLAHAQSFIIPCFNLFDKLKYLIGLKIYDWLAGKYRIGKSRFVRKEEVARLMPGVKTAGLRGGVEYFDGQFDDARLAINLAQTAAGKGAVLLNYCKATALSKNSSGKLDSVTFNDMESGETIRVQAKTIINATGVFVDEILQMDTPGRRPLVRPSQGTHIVIKRSFLGDSTALMIPKTSDGRVLFGVPWHDYLVLGTTDTPLEEHSLEPRALQSEIDFILSTAGNYLKKKPTRADILSIFSGLRPLAAPDKNPSNTKEISRDHKLIVSASSLITITGGKWTTYRKMAEETVDKAISLGLIPPADCYSQQLHIHGYSLDKQPGHWAFYGSDATAIQALAAEHPEWQQKLHPALDYIGAEVVWAVQKEMARTVEDVLARRIRVLFLDAQKAMEMALPVAKVMAGCMHKDEVWIQQQVGDFMTQAEGYLAHLTPNSV
ncbi:glycerol-3-phosphate dehydrogenase [bacterium A37T11]|nr:glycerol-3-phosphate dehydrogenase [bacterium A37T11]